MIKFLIRVAALRLEWKIFKGTAKVIANLLLMIIMLAFVYNVYTLVKTHISALVVLGIISYVGYKLFTKIIMPLTKGYMEIKRECEEERKQKLAEENNKEEN